LLERDRPVKGKLSDSTELVGVANEFNDVLAAIVGFAELAAANPHVRDDAKLALYIDEIRKSGLRGSELLLRWVNHAHAGNNAVAREKTKT
jgi:hypothetical protein